MCLKYKVNPASMRADFVWYTVVYVNMLTVVCPMVTDVAEDPDDHTDYYGQYQRRGSDDISYNPNRRRSSSKTIITQNNII